MTIVRKKPLLWPKAGLQTAAVNFCDKAADLMATFPSCEVEVGREIAFANWLSPADEYGVWMQTRQAGQLRAFQAGQTSQLSERGPAELALCHLIGDSAFKLSIAELEHIAVLGREGLDPSVRQKRVFTSMDDRGGRTEFLQPADVLPALDRICSVWNEPPKESPAIFTALWICAATTNAHPFRDGNGRLGRALMAAFLYKTRVTEHKVIPFGALKYASQGNFEVAVRFAESTGNWLPLIKAFYVLVGSYSILRPRFEPFYQDTNICGAGPMTSSLRFWPT